MARRRIIKSQNPLRTDVPRMEAFKAQLEAIIADLDTLIAMSPAEREAAEAEENGLRRRIKTLTA